MIAQIAAVCAFAWLAGLIVHLMLRGHTGPIAKSYQAAFVMMCLVIGGVGVIAVGAVGVIFAIWCFYGW